MYGGSNSRGGCSHGDEARHGGVGGNVGVGGDSTALQSQGSFIGYSEGFVGIGAGRASVCTGTGDVQQGPNSGASLVEGLKELIRNLSNQSNAGAAGVSGGGRTAVQGSTQGEPIYSTPEGEASGCTSSGSEHLHYAVVTCSRGGDSSKLVGSSERDPIYGNIGVGSVARDSTFYSGTVQSQGATIARSARIWGAQGNPIYGNYTVVATGGEGVETLRYAAGVPGVVVCADGGQVVGAASHCGLAAHSYLQPIGSDRETDNNAALCSGITSVSSRRAVSQGITERIAPSLEGVIKIQGEERNGGFRSAASVKNVRGHCPVPTGQGQVFTSSSADVAESQVHNFFKSNYEPRESKGRAGAVGGVVKSASVTGKSGGASTFFLLFSRGKLLLSRDGTARAAKKDSEKAPICNGHVCGASKTKVVSCKAYSDGAVGDLAYDRSSRDQGRRTHASDRRQGSLFDFLKKCFCVNGDSKGRADRSDTVQDYAFQGDSVHVGASSSAIGGHYLNIGCGSACGSDSGIEQRKPPAGLVLEGISIESLGRGAVRHGRREVASSRDIASRPLPPPPTSLKREVPLMRGFHRIGWAWRGVLFYAHQLGIGILL